MAEGAVLLWLCWRNCPHYGIIIMTCIVIVSDCISLPFPLHLSLQSQWASLSIIKKWQAHPRLLQPPDETHVYTPTCAQTHTRIRGVTEEWQEVCAALVSLRSSLTFQ